MPADNLLAPEPPQLTTFPEAYEVVGSIGKGGAAIVYEVVERSTGEHQALKIVYAPRAILRFRREVAIQRTLQHPHIVPVIASDLAATHPWMTLPLADETVLMRIRRQKYEADEAVAVLLPIVAALEMAHASGIVHRDVKPSNVLLFGATPRLADFGIAKTDWSRMTVQGTALGSRQFMAPEQVVDARTAVEQSDFYGLGSTLYAMITGKKPVGLHVLPRDHPRWAKVPTPVQDAILELTRPLPADRPKNAGTVMSMLEGTIA